MANRVHFIYFGLLLSFGLVAIIPKLEYFKQKYLNKILLTNYDIFENRENIFIICNNTIDNNITYILEEKLKASYKLNIGSIVFSFYIIIGLLVLVYKEINRELKKKIKTEIIAYIIIFIMISLFYFIDWAIYLAIYVKINNIRKDIDKIGLTNEIRRSIIGAIIYISICLVYFIIAILILFKDLKSNKEIENVEIENVEIENVDKIKKLEKEIEELKKGKMLLSENDTLESNRNNRINELREEIINKDSEINEIKSCNPYLLKKNEKLLSIIFISNDQTIHYSVICKNTDKFVTPEQSLYEKYNNYREGQNMFLFNGDSLNRNKTIDELKIKNGDIITVTPFEI